MSYFLFNPAREVLEKRRKRIAGDLETATRRAAKMLRSR
ncbi:MAG: hypothetical protein ACLR78_05785 [Roseburia sp.]